MRTSDRIKSFFMMLFFMITGMAGVTGAFLSVVMPPYHRLQVFVGMVVFCIIFTLIYELESGRKKIGILVGLFVLYAVYLFWKRDEIKAGFIRIAETVLQHANQYYKMNLIIVGNISGDAEETTLAILIILFGMTAVLGYGIICRFSKCITALLFLLPLAGGLLLGRVPEFPWLICMILCYAGVTAGSGKVEVEAQWIKKKSALVMAGAAGVAALAAALLISPVIENQYPGIQKANIQLRGYIDREVWPKLTRFDEWFAGNGIDQTVSGDLEHADGFSYTGARALTVSLQEKPENTVYLKGFAASRYTGKAWEPSPEDDLQHFAQSYGWDSADRVEQDVWNLEFTAAQVINSYQGDSDVQDMEIRRITAPSQYTYYPYGAYLDEDISMYGDGALKGVDASGWSFAFLPVDGFYPSSYPGNPLEPAGWSVLEQQYEQYVYSKYLEFPQEQLPRLIQQCNESGMAGAGVQAISDYIVQTLGDAAVYNLNTGRCPDDQEFTEYFLYERKEGYCVHFATAATLMFRMLGIPARYVTGYIAPANSFKGDGKGVYTATVEDQKAHAWTEIYISRLGWIPVETTPAYVTAMPQTDAGEQENPGQTEQQQNDQATEVTTTPSPDTDTEGKEEGHMGGAGLESDSGGPVVKGLYIFGNIILGIAAVAIAVLLWRYLKLWHRRRDFTAYSNSENIRNIFRYLYQALLFAGFSEEIDVTSGVFIEKLCSRYTELSFEESQLFMDLVMRASYSADKLEKRDCQAAWKFYRKVCKAICGRLPWYRKFMFRFLLTFY